MRLRRDELRFDGVDAGLALLVAWAGLSLAWSPDRLGGIDTVVKFALLGAIFVAVRHARDGALDKLIAASVILAALLSMLMERTGMVAFGGYFNQNYQTEMLMLAVPFMALAHHVFERPVLRWPGWILAGLTVLYLLVLNASKMEFVALPAMGFTVLLVLAWRKARWLAAGVVLLALAVFALLAWLGWESGFAGLTGAVNTSLLPRIELTLNTLLIWLEHPLWGTGAGGFTATYPLFQTAHRDILPFDTGSGMLTQQAIILAQAHNDIAQFLAVFGLVGVAIVLFGVVRAWRQKSFDLQVPLARMGGLVVVGALANALIDFPFQNAASALLAVIGCAWLLRPPVAAESATAADPSPSLLRTLPLLLCAGLVVASAFWGWRLYQGHVAFNAGAKSHYADPETSFGYMVKAIRMYPPSVNFRLQAYMSLVFWEDRTGSRQPAHLHEEAFAVSLSAGPQAIALLPRLQYLYNRGRYDGEEVERWRAHLRKNAPDVANVWLQEALFELRNGNAEAVADALARYERLAPNPVPYVVSLIANIRQEAGALGAR